uniref:GatB/YqeY domain-containing protein n=1 Tax=Compsopogon caeruleus TaxID=31354 RepID=A0A7S1XBG1_9RHOD|mmetsp:Transcript_11460/g.23253  ORF Transcript_11460/g.23253 Transcript_11460/m.23253 type:complete len:194 (+) Transcript_11460:98-679(+)
MGWMRLGFQCGWTNLTLGGRRATSFYSGRNGNRWMTPLRMMSLVDDVSRDMKQAMRDKDVARLKALRNMRAAFLMAMKEDGAEALSDEVAGVVLRRLAKQRRESIEMYRSGGREDLVAEEEAEMEVIEHYLPQLAGEDQTRRWVREAMEQMDTVIKTGDKSAMGKVMGLLMKNHKAEVDGNVAKRIVAEELSR